MEGRAEEVNASIPLAVRDAMDRGSCYLLPDGAAWIVLTEVSLAPCCSKMRAISVVRQRITPTSSTWSVACWDCDKKPVDDPLVRSTVRMFDVLEG
jgi:hypothetical protein